jgi:Bacterial SH3 domain/Outer membrane protein beta-barrel domain
MILRFISFLIIQLAFVGHVFADEPEVKSDTQSETYQKVKIADPYADMHTGPGGGYPIFHVVQRGEIVEVIQRRTSWFKIRKSEDLIGWVSIEQMSETISPVGEKTEFTDVTQEDFIKRHWELGVMGGSFGGATALTGYAAYLFNKGLSAEFAVSRAIGNASSSFLYNIGLVMQPFPEWRVSPYFHIGTGIIDVDPNTTLIQPRDRTNQFSNIGIGARIYLTKQIIFRLEYSEYILFSARVDNDDNEDINEWKAGFAVFF